MFDAAFLLLFGLLPCILMSVGILIMTGILEPDLSSLFDSLRRLEEFRAGREGPPREMPAEAVRAVLRLTGAALFAAGCFGVAMLIMALIS